MHNYDQINQLQFKLIQHSIEYYYSHLRIIDLKKTEVKYYGSKSIEELYNKGHIDLNIYNLITEESIQFGFSLEADMIKTGFPVLVDSLVFYERIVQISTEIIEEE